MERAPTAHEDIEDRPTLAEAKIILWDELYGVMKDIACGQKEASASNRAAAFKVLLSAGH